jgi:hypothetical protein
MVGRIGDVPVPIFVSVPSMLSETQTASLACIHAVLAERGLVPVTLRTSHTQPFPLTAVHALALTCAGGLILGYEQSRIVTGVTRPSTPREQSIDGPVPLPTPWNHLEAGILVALGLPLLIFREPGVRGGIFDDDATEVLLYDMPYSHESLVTDGLAAVFDEWTQAVLARVAA